MQAIILAAGMGRRLGELTAENTKCMVKVNGERLIDRMLSQLSQLHLERIIIVVGYKGEALRRHLEEHHAEEPIVIVENPVYDKTNNIYSLWLTRPLMELDETTLLLESDLIFEDDVLRLLTENPTENIALVSKYETWNDGTMVCIDEEGNITRFVPKKFFKYSETGSYYKTVNMYKFSRRFLLDEYMPFLEAYIKVLGENEYYEQVLRVLTMFDHTDLKAVPVGRLRWYEIDDVQDLRIAEILFADAETRLERFQHSYGGYWRYPQLLDFCYLVNPYFPTPKMIEEMKANFEPLLRDYPSGMGVNSLLAAKYFGLRQEFTVVGNGAAELIKSLMETLEGSLGVVLPTFEEYPNRKVEKEYYHPQKGEFRYDADDLIGFFGDKDISSLLIVNPDNPSGNFIPKEGLMRLIEWSAKKGIRLIVDESFVDFAADGERHTLLDNRLLQENPHLIVVKSISKSYGVPGLRLGIIASGDMELIAGMKKDVAIWNINSFAEFYLQIFGKYEDAYKKACRRYPADRALFATQLEETGLLKVYPSEANYFLCETLGIGSHELTLRLLSEHNILIKDCGTKAGFGGDGRQYIRIALRSEGDNARLAAALREIKGSL